MLCYDILQAIEYDSQSLELDSVNETVRMTEEYVVI